MTRHNHSYPSTFVDVTSGTGTMDVALRLAAIVECSNDAIISKNCDGVISTWNPAAERLFGYSEAEAIGRAITLIIPSELHAEEMDILSRLRAGERIEGYETRRVTRDAHILDVSITISPIRNAKGTIIGASKILRDITDSKRARAALQESERRLAKEVAGARTLQAMSTRLISESRQESLLAGTLDAAMELMGANASSIQMLAADGESLVLLGWRNFHPESAAFWKVVTAEAGSTCGRALRDNERVMVTDVDDCEFMAGTQDAAEYRRCGIRAVQSTPLQSRAGRPLGMISTHWSTPHTPTDDDFRLFDVLARQVADLLERTRAENELRESEERFRLIADTAPVVIWMCDTQKQRTYVNRAWIDLTGRPLEAALGHRWTDCVHPDDVVRFRDAYATAFEQQQPFQAEYRLRRHDGEYRWIVGTGVPRYDANGSFAGYIGSGLDITERKLAEEALATINDRLIEVQDEERTRIARELHDDITQRLALLSIVLDELVQGQDTSAAQPRHELVNVRDEAMALSKDLRTVAHRLHPEWLEYLGIATAAAGLCETWTGHKGVTVTFNAESIPEGLSRRIAVCLYRVLQEALQNAIKHSGTKKVEVSLRGTAEHIELTIRDFGAGFTSGTTPRRGIGVTSMRERLSAVRGWLAIESRPKQGATIRAHVPFSRD